MTDKLPAEAGQDTTYAGHEPVKPGTVTFQRAVEEELIQKRFDKLADEWKRDTLLMSKVSAMVIHPAYQKIIGMGPVAIPCILRDLRDNGPEHWFWALHMISDENPVPGDKVGDVSAMTEAWLQWGSKKGYLDTSPQTTQVHSQT